MEREVVCDICKQPMKRIGNVSGMTYLSNPPSEDSVYVCEQDTTKKTIREYGYIVTFPDQYGRIACPLCQHEVEGAEGVDVKQEIMYFCEGCQRYVCPDCYWPISCRCDGCLEEYILSLEDDDASTGIHSS